MVNKKEQPRYDFFYSRVGNGMDTMEIRRVWDSGRGGRVGRRFNIGIWRKYARAGLDDRLLKTLIRYTEKQWDAFLMMEAMSGGEFGDLTI